MFKPKKAPHRHYKSKLFERHLPVTKFIYQVGESPLLRKQSKKVAQSSFGLTQLHEEIKYLKKCLRNYKKYTGVGRAIAAPQVGIPKRIAVVFVDDQKILVLINPIVIKASKTLLKYPEMCMSAFPVVAPVVRPSWIEFEYFDETGNKNIWNIKDTNRYNRMLNRVFQHEIDHMEGIINIDKVVSSRHLFLLSDKKFYEKARFVKVSLRKTF